MRKPNKWIILAATIVIAITLIVFFVGFGAYDKIAVDYIALTFVLVAEILALTGLLTIMQESNNKLFIRNGVTSALTIYWLVTTIISIFYKPLIGNNIHGLITTQFIVIALTAIAIIGIILAALNHKTEIKPDPLWQNYENTVFALKSDENLSLYNKQLEGLYEAIKYSDKTLSLPEIEHTIYGKLDELYAFLAHVNHEIQKDEAIYKINNIILLFKQRNQLVLNNKKGGY